MSNKFILINRDQPFVIPVQEWLSDDHLARFIVAVIDCLDVSALEASYSGGGSPPYPPKMILALLFYGYVTGTFTSRKLKKSTYEYIPVIYISGNTHPDHNTINEFRKRFLGEMKELFIQILLYAYGLGVLRLGDVSLDGTKIHANASKNNAMSWGYANRLEEQLRAEVEALLKKAEEAEDAESVQGMKVGEEIARRQVTLQQIGDAKAELEARAQLRFDAEKEAYDAKQKQRQEREKELGHKLGGRKPKPPEPGPLDTDQVNFTDPESRIMPVSGGGFEQCYNAQACVDQVSRLIIENHLTQAPNDKQELKPALLNLDALPDELGHVDHIAADTGYCSASNAEACEQQNVIPLLACGREAHHPSPEARFADAGEAPPAKASPMERMQHRIKTTEGKKIYAKRKSTVEPAFGVIKQVMGFRQFLLRGLDAVTGEWTLVCIAYNLKRLHVLAG